MDFSYLEGVIRKTYGDRVTFAGKSKILSKFGKNGDLGTSGTVNTVMQLFGTEIEETYVNDNLIDAVVSDDSNTQDVVIEGHTISGTDLTFVSQTVTLTGTTPAVLTTPLARATRITLADGEPGLATDSTVYVYQDTATVTAGVPQESNLIHVSMEALHNQSLKASTSLSSVDYWAVTGFVAGIDRGVGSSRAEFFIQTRKVSSNGGFKTAFIVPANSAGSTVAEVAFPTPILIPKNTDVRIQAVGTANSIGVTAQIFGSLARIA